MSAFSLPSPSSLVGWLFLALATATALAGWRRPRPPVWWWWAALGLALVCFRWPLIWLPHELYPDESELLGGAITLRSDPVFWRALTMGTAGPLDCYVLLPATWFTGAAVYAGARLIGAVLVWALLVAVGETLVAVTGLARTRLATLPAFLFLMFTTSPEYIHHSTELLANLLVAAAGWAAARQLQRPARSNLVAAGLLLGAVPWAKLQLVPLAGGLGLFLIVWEFTAGRRREIPLLIAMALLPTLLVFLVLTATGQTEHMIVPYVVQNFLYVQTGRQALSLVAQLQWDQAMVNGYIAAWIVGAFIFCALTAALCRGRVPPASRNLVLGGLIGLGLAAICILTPGRPYPHYLQLLLIPVTVLIGAALATWPSPPAVGSRAALVLFLALLIAPSLALRIWPRPDPYAYYNLVATAPSAGHHQLVAKLKSLARPHEALGLWGWRASLYVETGMRQATRESHPLMLMISGPGQGYFLRSYYEKFVETAPPVFVDATGPGNFYFTDRRQGHEIYPLLRDWVQTHYTLLEELDGARIYVRNDRLAAPAR